MTPLLIAMTVAAGGDELTLRDSTEGHAAELYYNNTGGQRSAPGVYILSHNGIEIRVWLRLEGNGDERITCEDTQRLLVCYPAEIAIPDGSDTVLQIMEPMF